MEEYDHKIPKQLAARLRAKYRRLGDRRESLVSYEFTRDVELGRVAEFNRDPEVFSSKYYGNHGPDSYPIKTTIYNSMQRIYYADERISEISAEIEELEREVPELEREIREAVSSIRKITKGRVSWPDRPDSIKDIRNRHQQEIETSDRAHQETAACDRAWVEENDRIMEEMKRKEEEESSKAIAAHRAQLSPEERAKEDALNERLLRAIKSGDISVDRVIEWARKPSQE